MTRSTVDAMFCDAEDGCTEWAVDYYTSLASNWRDLLAGWHYDPRTGVAYCPNHIAEVTR